MDDDLGLLSIEIAPFDIEASADTDPSLLFGIIPRA
jgi:hypothetical protein